MASVGADWLSRRTWPSWTSGSGGRRSCTKSAAASGSQSPWPAAAAGTENEPISRRHARIAIYKTFLKLYEQKKHASKPERDLAPDKHEPLVIVMWCDSQCEQAGED